MVHYGLAWLLFLSKIPDGLEHRVPQAANMELGLSLVTLDQSDHEVINFLLYARIEHFLLLSTTYSF